MLPEIVSIPAGVYRMGSADGRDEERPVHEVGVDAFGIGRFQVVNEEYDLFRRETGHGPTKFRERFSRPRQPVAGPSWRDAAAYCRWLSEQTGDNYRLPTEAEWEWAARGGLRGKTYPWGDEPVEKRAGYANRWREGPEDVGGAEPNGFGLFDMCENMHEWCVDWYDPYFYALSPRLNPCCERQTARRSSRGGAWRHHVKIARCAARSSIPPHLEYADYGFRVVRVMEKPGADCPGSGETRNSASKVPRLGGLWESTRQVRTSNPPPSRTTPPSQETDSTGRSNSAMNRQYSTVAFARAGIQR